MTVRRGGYLVVPLAAAAVIALLAAGPLAAQHSAPREIRGHAAWHKAMQALRAPRGCSTAAYPTVRWNRARCVTAPQVFFGPAAGHRPFQVGNIQDYSATADHLIEGIEGSFPTVIGVTDESGPWAADPNKPPLQTADSYSLQINTNRFVTPLCNDAAAPASCRGWQQFLYSSDGGTVWMQYWLINFNKACPDGWRQSPKAPAAPVHCVTDSPSVQAPKQPITELINLCLNATAVTGGNDTVTLITKNKAYAQSNADSVFGLHLRWTDAEFLIAGDGNSSQAHFIPGSTIEVKTVVHHGRPTAPTCVNEGFTGETNDLTLVGTPAITKGPSPALVSRQSNVETSTKNCQTADGFGDTHLSTFKGLLYDFQASGDFFLARSPTMNVQVRQRSGAPTWPNASVNKSVGAQFGSTRIAVCLPDQVQVNGQPKTVTPGNPLLLADGSDVSRDGNTYLIRGPHGDSVTATLFGDWINVGVGLARSAGVVRGLLANANSVNQVRQRNGLVLTWPVAFQTLYGPYGDGWRVPAGQSILCGKKAPASGPKAPMTPHSLGGARASSARAYCKSKGVTDTALLDACTLDVVVTGKKAAANAYVGRHAPVAVGVPK